jgi:hypothetical protein
MSAPNDTDVAEVMLRGLASAVRVDGRLTDTQTNVLAAIGTYVLGCDVPPDQLAPIDPAALADAIPEATLRRRVVHGMLALEIAGQTIPTAVVDQVDAYAKALDVDESMLNVGRDFAEGARKVAFDDYLRNSYPLEYYTEHGVGGGVLHSSESPSPTGDPELAARWNALEHCPAGSLGRIVWDFYQRRGFSVPGTPGAVDALLAQHDWVHCVADYGTSAVGEIEVFTFIASSIPDMKGFSFLVVILGLFESGGIEDVPGVATADAGHLDAPGVPVRFADALRRGLAMNLDVMGGIDWFQHADTPIAEVRRTLNVPPKGEDAIAAGSLSAQDPNAVFSHVDKSR